MLKKGLNQRDVKWTESIAACPLNQVFSFNWGGVMEFMMDTKAKLGSRAIGRSEIENDDGLELKDSQNPYTLLYYP